MKCPPLIFIVNHGHDHDKDNGDDDGEDEEYSDDIRRDDGHDEVNC